MSELKPLVTITVFVGSLILLLGQIPVFLTTDSYDHYRTVEYSEYWDTSLFQNYADTNTTVIDPDVSLALWKGLPDYPSLSLFSQELDDGDGDFGGYEEIWLLSRYTANTSEGRIYIAYPLQRFLGFGWVTRWGWAEWYFTNGTSVEINSWAYDDNRFLNKKILEEYFEETDDFGVQMNFTSFKVKLAYEGKGDTENALWFDVHFSFDTSIYGDPQFAWDSNTGDPVPDELYVLCGIDFDQTRTAYGAQSVLTALLFFNLPQVLGGMPVIFGAILSLSVWGAILYISYIIILRTIGAVFGGGA